ncbi:hypothetical protein AB0K43_01265 [Kitasatospora sp. NPDC049258]|uniref:hypothetical protein n=1 Tax=Kitasatospora sp. NPDC049258 TaxID=3155394 RepID=UPI00342A095D
MAPSLLRSGRRERAVAVPSAGPAPVFVDQSGTRGRRMRGVGWLIGVLTAVLAATMTTGLVGMQSQAPALRIPVQPTPGGAEPGASALPATVPSASLSPSPATSGSASSRSATPPSGKATGRSSATGSASATGSRATAPVAGKTTIAPPGAAATHTAATARSGNH